MDGKGLPSAPGSPIGIAGRPTTDQERSYVRQAVFLLRYRLRRDAVLQGAFPLDVQPEQP